MDWIGKIGVALKDNDFSSRIKSSIYEKRFAFMKKGLLLQKNRWIYEKISVYEKIFLYEKISVNENRDSISENIWKLISFMNFCGKSLEFMNKKCWVYGKNVLDLLIKGVELMWVKAQLRKICSFYEQKYSIYELYLRKKHPI